MKNSILAFVLLCACGIAMTGCGSKEIKDIKGQVAGIETVKDTLTCAKLLIDGDTVVFKMADARFINGMFMYGSCCKGCSRRE